MSVNVVIIPDVVTPGNNELVSTYFTDPLFNVVPIPDISGIRYDTGEEESVLYIEILRKYNDKPVIVIKNSSVSLLTTDQIANYVSQSLSIDSDVYYLTRWDYQCQMTRLIPGYQNFIRVFSPHGLQAIMFYPSALNKIYSYVNDMDKYVNSLIYKGDIKAISNTDNLFNYGVYNYGDDNSFFNRLNLCSNVAVNIEVNNVNRYLYIGGIIFLIFLIAWGMRKMGPNSDYDVKQDEAKIPNEYKWDYLPFNLGQANLTTNTN